MQLFSPLRLGYSFFFYGDKSSFYSDYPDAGCLWNLIAPLFEDRLVSMLSNLLAVIFIAGLVSFLNSTYVLIREKTALPEAFILLLLSCHPAFLFFSPYLLAMILVIGAAYHLFASYNAVRKPIVCSNIMFEVALASLFIPQILAFCLVFLVGFAMMRNFTFRALLASILTVVLVYVPVVFYYFASDNTQILVAYLSYFGGENLSSLPLLSFETSNWIIWGLAAGYIILLSVFNYINNYKDKILIRAYINFLGEITIFAIIFYAVLNINVQMNIYVSFFAGSLLLAHFQGLNRTRFALFFFLLSLVVYILICCKTFL